MFDEEKSQDSYALFIGINRSVNPGIRVLIDFLSFYFERNEKEKSAYSFSWKDKEEKINEIVICKEESESVRKNLSEAVLEWLKSYSTFKPIDGNNSKNYLLPLTPGMLMQDDNVNKYLRNLLNSFLYAGLRGEEQDQLFQEIQTGLFNMLYSERARLGGYEELLYILSYLFDGNAKEINKAQLNRERIVKIDALFLKLSNQFKTDLLNLIHSKYLIHESVYKKISELNILCNFYIVRYMIIRSFDGAEPFVLAKGSLNMPSDGKIHSAAVMNFAGIRELIYKVSANYYEKMIDEINDRDRRLKLFIKETKDSRICLMRDRKDIWPKVRQKIFRIHPEVRDEKGRQKALAIEKMLLDFLGGSEKEVLVNNREIAYACMEISKKRDSSVRKVSSVFASHGKECYFAYPIGKVRQKYYVMSPALTEVLVYIFLEEQEEGRGTLENFYQWLEKRYCIYLRYSPKMIKYFKQNAIEQPSQMDFSENQKAFIQTLEEINCIVKLSDNSYIITYDNEAGRW